MTDLSRAPISPVEAQSNLRARELAAELGAEVSALNHHLYRVLMTGRDTGKPRIVLVATGARACEELTDWCNLQRELGITREVSSIEVRR